MRRASELSANTDLICLWKKDDVWMRPITQRVVKQVRQATRLAQRSSRLAAEAEDAAAAAERKLEAVKRRGTDEEIAAAQRAFDDRAARADELESEADQHHAETGRIIFEEIVVDGDGALFEYDADDVSPAIIVRLWARIEKVFDKMGKSRRGRRRRATSGSARRA